MYESIFVKTSFPNLLKVAGPMWSGSIHDKEFTEHLLQHVEEHSSHYGTSARLKGMVTLAHEVRSQFFCTCMFIHLVLKELDVPFYFTPQKIASFFHSTSPSLGEIAYANMPSFTSEC